MKFRLKISTPNGLFFHDYVDALNIKTAMGYLTILYDHTPIVTTLEIASLTYRVDGEERTCAIAGGVMHATRRVTFIVTNAIEYKEEIDIHRAHADYNKMVKLMEERKELLNSKKAEFTMKKALNRIKTYKK